MTQQEVSQWGALIGLDRVIHEPARLAVMAILSVVEAADFLYLQRETALTKGNLSAHLSRLEEAGYIAIDKTFRDKMPHTLCRLTPQGRDAFNAYLRQVKGALGALGEAK